MICPKCGSEMEWGLTWIEHQGIGHPGHETWFCSCGYVAPIKPLVETVVWSSVQITK
jgi:hypothetical protein